MDPEEYEDPALRMAIEESLRDQSSKHHAGTQRDVVDLTADSDDDELRPQAARSVDLAAEEIDDEEDEDLKRAIALSMQEMNSHSPQPQPEEVGKNDAHHTSQKGKNSNSNSAPPNVFGLLGIDRKKQEEERLARVAKRKAEQNISPPPASRETKKARPNLTEKEKAATSSSNPYISLGQPATTQPSSSHARAATEKGKPATNVTPSSNPSIQFPKGVVKKTWVFGCPRKGDDIKIEEVFQRSDLELAILSAFQWDMEWLFSKLDTARSRFVLVMQAKEESTKRQYEAETAQMSNLRLCFPPMDGQVNCMHSKLMLLFHPNYLRIVIPSANLVPYDWGEAGGVMENTVFLIDLPKKPAHSTSEKPTTAFFEDLVYFLRASTLHENLIAKLSDFDFSETARFAFVHTIGGSHTGDAWRRTGHCGLGRAVTALGLRTHKPVNIDFVTSSVGSLTDEFLRSIYLASQGDDGLTEFTLRTAKTFPAKSPSDPSILVQKTTGAEWKDHFRVYFPSERTVKESKGGPMSAGTICFQAKWYAGPKFPRHVLRDCISRREGLLMHNKMLFARPETPIRLADGSVCEAWSYIGSANLSESAWGRLVQDRNTKEPKLNCRNWECGVLVPIIRPAPASPDDRDSKIDDKERKNRDKAMDMDIEDVFGDTVPVPMRVPARPYEADLKPWFYLEGM
ncbi:hypothetical protein VTN77DRAFT_7189 [Rasamsonia byssochlamydoides]|uniref:uncharacterized protein n=1 Tax=Rasamsonia byssochlamydoides TaxID=89139 RepID=UPI00374267A5